MNFRTHNCIFSGKERKKVKLKLFQGFVSAGSISILIHKNTSETEFDSVIKLYFWNKISYRLYGTTRCY